MKGLSIARSSLRSYSKPPTSLYMDASSFLNFIWCINYGVMSPDACSYLVFRYFKQSFPTFSPASGPAGYLLDRALTPSGTAGHASSTRHSLALAKITTGHEICQRDLSPGICCPLSVRGSLLDMVHLTFIAQLVSYRYIGRSKLWR